MSPYEKRSFTLYWSSLKKYEDCPQNFLWSRGWGNIDCGGGPGRRKPKPVQKTEHHAVMGIVLANFWEWLYNDEEWRRAQGLADRLLEKARMDFSRLLLDKFIDWRLAPSRDEMWEVIEAGVRGYLRTMKANKLLGPYARSEVDLTCYIDKWTPIGGRADLIFRRPDTGVVILDGKNSRRYKDRKTGGWMTFTDPDQLRWYALCFYLTHGVMVDKLGFVYFRYPYGQECLDTDGDPIPEVDEKGVPTGLNVTEKGIDWVPYSREDLEGIATRAKDVFRALNREKFQATPSPPRCKFCDYETVCPERQAQKSANRNRRRVKDPLLADMGGKGFVMMGIGSDGGSVPFEEG